MALNMEKPSLVRAFNQSAWVEACVWSRVRLRARALALPPLLTSVLLLGGGDFCVTLSKSWCSQQSCGPCAL
jgi:hypothetical protein